MTKKILLTGASGNIGFLVFKELLKNPSEYKVKILALGLRNEKKLFEPYKNLVEIVWGDLRDTETVNKAINGVEVVIHLGAVIPPLVNENPLLAEQVNVGGTQNIVNARKLHENKAKLIFSSSITVYGDRLDDPWIKIGDPLLPNEGDLYGFSKVKAEEIITSSGIEWTIFRLTTITNPNYSFTPIIFHVPLCTSTEWCSAVSVAKCFVNAIESDEIWGNIYNLGGGEKWRLTYRDFLINALKTFGVGSSVLKDDLFATKNFSCGYYADSKQLNDILDFQDGSIDDYFQELRSNTPLIFRLLYQIVPSFIIRLYFERISEPSKALKTGNPELQNKYF